jgi:hypothetical protein
VFKPRYPKKEKKGKKEMLIEKFENKKWRRKRLHNPLALM